MSELSRLQAETPVGSSASSDRPPEDRIRIGELRAAYGLQGWVWVYSDTDPVSNIFGYEPWWVETHTGFQKLNVKRWRTQGKGLVVSLQGVQDRSAADLLMGAGVWVDRAALPPAREDEYYWSDLVGLKVYGYAAEIDDQVPTVLLGEIREMFETGANDVIVVQPCKGSIDQTERMIPWHTDIVRNIDLVAGRMDVHWGVDY